MYGRIDGTGPDTADRIHEAYPAAVDSLGLPAAESMDVEGIGPKRADAIYSARFETGREAVRAIDGTGERASECRAP